MSEKKGDNGSREHRDLARQVGHLTEKVAKIEGEQTKAEARDTEYKGKQLSIAADTLRLNKWMAFFTFLLVLTSVISGWIGNKSASAAQDAVRLSREQFVLSDRPYIQIVNLHIASDTDKVRPVVGEPVYAGVEFNNLGKSPALNVLVHRHLVVGERYDLVRKVDPDISREGDTVFPGGRGFNTTAPLVKDTFSVENFGFPKEQLIRWNGEYPLVVFGRVTYSDRIGNKYCFAYGSLYLQNGAWLYLDRDKHPPCPPGYQQD